MLRALAPRNLFFGFRGGGRSWGGFTQSAASPSAARRSKPCQRPLCTQARLNGPNSSPDSATFLRGEKAVDSGVGAK